MTSAEKWNLIVDGYKQLYTSLESKIQVEWEMYCAELLGYKKLLHEIDSQRHLSVGSGGSIIPDIILRVDQKDIFDIELKQYTLPFSETFENQLISYLNQTHLSIGMVVCNKIYLYYYEYATVTINKIEIPFEKDNSDGISLIELLSKETFSEGKIKDYVLGKLQHKKVLEEIKKQLNNEWFKAVVKEKLMEKFAEVDVDNVLCDYSFKVNQISKSPALTTMPSPIAPTAPVSVNTSNYDVLPLIHKWCADKHEKGELIFLQNHSNKKYIRFTTPDLDEIIPYQNGCKSGWNNGHYYTYEIIRYDGKFKIWVSFSNVNTPVKIKNVYDQIPQAIGIRPKNEDWRWWGIFSTKPFSYSNITEPEVIYKELDLQFEQIRANVAMMIRNLK